MNSTSGEKYKVFGISSKICNFSVVLDSSVNILTPYHNMDISNLYGKDWITVFWICDIILGQAKVPDEVHEYAILCACLFENTNSNNYCVNSN